MVRKIARISDRESSICTYDGRLSCFISERSEAFPPVAARLKPAWALGKVAPSDLACLWTRGAESGCGLRHRASVNHWGKVGLNAEPLQRHCNWATSRFSGRAGLGKLKHLA